MKLTSSAFQHFLLCATTTAVASASILSGTIPNNKVESQHQLPFESNRIRKREKEETEFETETFQEPLLHHRDEDHSIELSDLGLHNHHNHHNHHKVDRNGVLVSSPEAETTSQQELEEKRTPCHPDLGALACTQSGEYCRKSLPSEMASDKNSKQWDWHCAPKNSAMFAGNKSSRKHRRRQTSKKGRRQLNYFPPSGERYDRCTYDLEYDYKYESTIFYPSGWDRCVCELYKYNLPNAESGYDDAEYCHRINIYYCANYYEKDADPKPNSYDACLCALYNSKPIPDKRDDPKLPERGDDFCVELPIRYCDSHYAEGDVVGIAKCLCDIFEYTDWCDFTAPPGFVPVQPPSQLPPDPTLEPTAFPTRMPTLKPTKQPTTAPSKNPSGQPSIKPTAQPTNQPTKEPTDSPIPPTPQPFSGEPTSGPTRKPTSKPTGEPTKFEEPVVDPTPKPVTPTTAPSRGTFQVGSNFNRSPTLPTMPPVFPPTPTRIAPPVPGRNPPLQEQPTNPPKNSLPEGNTNSNKNNSNRPPPTSAPTDKPMAKPTSQPTKSKEESSSEEENKKKEDSGRNKSEDSKSSPGRGPFNVNNVSNAIDKLKRQPNIADRPGASLRLATVQDGDGNELFT